MAQFRLQGTKVLAVDMSGDSVKARNGSMVVYEGQMTFKKLSGGGEGLRRAEGQTSGPVVCGGVGGQWPANPCRQHGTVPQGQVGHQGESRGVAQRWHHVHLEQPWRRDGLSHNLSID